MKQITWQSKIFRALCMCSCIITASCCCTATHTPVAVEHMDATRQQWAQQQVVAQLAKYEDAIRRMAYDEVAALYAVNGEVAHNHDIPVKGRETIRQYLASFSDYKVLANRIQAQATEVSGNVAHQVGVYAQHVITPANETLHVSGRFRAFWQRLDNGNWQIIRMHTMSAS